MPILPLSVFTIAGATIATSVATVEELAKELAADGAGGGGGGAGGGTDAYYDADDAADVAVEAPAVLAHTAAVDAAERGDILDLQLCLEAGASLDATDRFGLTPLHAAARSGSIPCLLHIHSSAPHQLHAERRQSWTPLHDAAYGGKAFAACVLVALGADPAANTTTSLTAVKLRNSHGDTVHWEAMMRSVRQSRVKDAVLDIATGEVVAGFVLADVAKADVLKVNEVLVVIEERLGLRDAPARPYDNVQARRAAVARHE